MKYVLRLYPSAWRQRYGDELEALLEDGGAGWRSIPNLFAAAMKEQFNMQSFTRLTGWLSATGLAVGFAASFAVTPQYTSHAVIELRTTDAPAILDAARHEAGSRYALAQIINDPQLNLYITERRNAPLEDVENDMRHDTRVASLPVADPQSARLSIDFTYSDPLLAQKTLVATIGFIHNAIDRHFEQVRFEHISVLEKRVGVSRLAPQYGQHRDSPKPYEFSEVNGPSLPEHPVSPNRALFAATGFGGGIATAFLVALLRRRSYPMTGPIAL